MQIHHINRRGLIRYLTLSSLFCQAFASTIKDIKIVSAFPAGASVDFWARRLESEIRNRLTVDTIVMYAPGASGVIAANQVRKINTETNPALLIASTALFSQIPKLPDSGLNFDPNKAFQPVSILWTEPYYLAVRSDSPIQSLEDILVRSKRLSTAPSFGSAGSKSTGGLLIEHIARRNDLFFTHVPYKGMVEIVTNMLGGQIDIGLVSYQPIRSLVESGKVRLIATTGKRRSKVLPNCPSLHELKMLDIDGSVWFGLFASSELNTTIISNIQGALSPLLSSDEFRTYANANGFTPLGLYGKDAQRFVSESNDAWELIINRR